VIAPVATTDSALEVLSAEIPIVVVEAAPQGEVSAVIVDQQKGAYIATKHLLDLGHRTVAHISGPSDWIEARERVVGWRRALEEAGVEPPAVIMGDWSAQSGYDAGRLIADASEITAVFAANDNMALGLLRALNERGRLIPRDLSVVGFDDVAEAAFFSPPLTTIRQDFAAMGSRAVELLLRQLAAPGRKVERIELTPELVLRESTAEA
jgi:DNA-binding LacI/PurR family transcriptional regulator